jgi:uncharacterized protein YeaO (DUF488 family)
VTRARRRSGTIRLRRVYDDPEPADGRRVFVDRLWPRGVPKSVFRFDEWSKAVAPTTELRRWYKHDAARWEEFTARYRFELGENEAAVAPLLAAARAGNLTLVYAARDPEHNHALVLKHYLEERLDDE